MLAIVSRTKTSTSFAVRPASTNAGRAARTTTHHRGRQRRAQRPPARATGLTDSRGRRGGDGRRSRSCRGPPARRCRWGGPPARAGRRGGRLRTPKLGSIVEPIVWATPSTMPPASVPHSDPRPPMTTASNANRSRVEPLAAGERRVQPEGQAGQGDGAIAGRRRDARTRGGSGSPTAGPPRDRRRRPGCAGRATSARGTAGGPGARPRRPRRCRARGRRSRSRR